MLKQKQVIDRGSGATGPLVCLLDEVGQEDVGLVGGKGASLGEMLQAGVRVPPGFVVTTAAFRRFMAKNRLSEVIEGLLSATDVNDSASLQLTAKQIQQIICSSPLMAHIQVEIEEAYSRLSNALVAVRSSATAEDLPGASFAGQHSTFLNVIGKDKVAIGVQACWASLFEPRAIFYRKVNGYRHDTVNMAVVVQEMVPAEVAGVMFTVNPTTGDLNTMLVEAIYGLGEPLVSGELSPDCYQVYKPEGKIVSREIVRQTWAMSPSGVVWVGANGKGNEPVPAPEQSLQKLSDEHIHQLAQLGLKLESHYGQPQDVEWALADGRLYIVQSRPITTLKLTNTAGLNGNGHHQNGNSEIKPIVSGSPASPGVASGHVRIIKNASEIHLVQRGDILVTEMTTPDFVPAMKLTAGIVTDRGGRTCHAAIVSREMGVPCVVGTSNATRVLAGYPVVTVDGGAGKVYSGEMHFASDVGKPTQQPRGKTATRTRLYVNLADPDAAKRVAAFDVDGVGLLRAEFIMAYIGEHPRAMLAAGRGAEFTRRLAEGVERFAESFAPRPVVYRFSDFKTNEYRNLKGGETCESHEENPMLGYRGCMRYLAEPDLFALEVDAVKQVRERFQNLWVMLPFVRTLNDLRAVKEMLEKQGLKRSESFKLWMMLEVPSNVLLLDQFLDVGVDGVSIGSNDLTQLILGVDRDNERLASVFDERDPAVLLALERVVKGCIARQVTVSICGQAPSVYPELTNKLVNWGITSVSVSPDAIDSTRSVIHEAENQRK